MVGDDWQSIYGFRDSRIDYIVRMRHYFPGPKSTVDGELSLASEIVALSNRFIRMNRNRTNKRLVSFKDGEGLSGGIL